MTDIEQRLRTAMHAAVDSAEASPDALVRHVMHRRRWHSIRAAVVAFLAGLAVAVPTLIVGLGGAVPASNHNAPPSHLPTKMTGQTMPAGTSFQFIVATPHGAGWYSTATRKIESIRGLPPVLGGYSFSPQTNGWILSSNRNPSPCAQNLCAGTPTAYYYVADGARTATLIGRSYTATMANQPNAAWLLTYPHVRSGWNVSPSVQLVSTSGTVLSPRYRVPPELLLQGQVGSSLLLCDSPGAHWELWNPRTGRVVEHFTYELAAGPDQVAWRRQANAHDPVLITNIATGHTISVPLALPVTYTDNNEPGNLSASFNADGRLLALQQVAGGPLIVVDTVTGKVTRIAGSALSAADWQNFYWQNGGDRLVITAGSQQTLTPVQVAYWQPGDTHLYVTRITNATESQEIQIGAVG